MRQGHPPFRNVILSVTAAITCHFVLAGCTPAPQTAPQTAVADLTISYRGQPISDTRIAARLDQEARVDTVTDDGHAAAVRVVIQGQGDGNYRTSVDVQYDGAPIGATGFLSEPGQSVASEGPDLRIALRVRP